MPVAFTLVGATLPGAAAATEDRGARIELMTTSTLYGAGVGTLAAVEFDLNPRPAAWMAAGLGGGLLYGSYRLSDELAFTTANVRYIESAGLWTGLDAALLTGALGAEGSSIGVAVGQQRGLWTADGERYVLLNGITGDLLVLE